MPLNKKNRLKKKKDFEEVFKRGRAVRGSFLLIKYKKNESDIPRFGFVVSAKVVPKAVKRNRIKRILSETARGFLKSLGGYDVIVLGTIQALNGDMNDLKRDLVSMLKKIS